MAKQTKETKQKEKKKLSKRQIINTICIVFLSLCVIVSVTAFILVQSILNNKTMDESLKGLQSENSTQLLDQNGELVTTLAGESGVRENISYDDIPQVVIDAFLAVEDSRYFKHGGFDLPRFLKSGYENILHGGVVQGGSTLTMQLVDVKLFKEEEKINFGMKEKLEQKIIEIFKSMDIESQISKEEIMEKYLNAINFGGQARGIQKGAEYYFNKDVKNLTLTEAAFLAGVINAPGSYNPYGIVGVEGIDYYAQATKRRNDVLYQMHNHGYISEMEYKDALSTDLAFQLTGVKNFGTEQYSSYVDAVVNEVQQLTGQNPYTTPMRIYTNMDREAQELADALCDGKDANGNIVFEYPDELFQSGFAAVDNQTGAILALGAGRGYSSGNDQRQNRATIDTHQPGSTAKPIVDYSLAFEEIGYSTEHVFEDGPVDNYTSDGKTLYNYDRTFSGDITIKAAVGRSLNIPAYKAFMSVLDKVGSDGIADYLNDYGLPLDANDVNASLSIGGGNLSMTPLQMASAYSTLANDGKRATPHTIKRIEFLNDEMEDYEVETEETKVISPESAYLTSVLLRDAVTTNYGTLVNLLNTSYPIYGKSGTTDYDSVSAANAGVPEGVAKDKWMVGYTNKYSVACWAGWDEGTKGKYLTENLIFLNIEGRVVKAMLDNLTDGGANATEIKRPSGVVSINHIQGLYPYATADNNDGTATVSALINKKFAKLENVAPDSLKDVASLNATMNGNTLDITFAKYPDEELLKEFSGTKTMSGGGVTVTGKQLFSKTKLFGTVRYNYEIFVNGKSVKTGSSASEKVSESISTKSGDEVYVVGWYGYSNASPTSNKVNSNTVTSNASLSYTVGTDFLALFNGDSASVKASLNNFFTEKMPGINISILNDPNTPDGEYSTLSTINAGMTVTSNGSYVVYVGTKK